MTTRITPLTTHPPQPMPLELVNVMAAFQLLLLWSLVLPLYFCIEKIKCNKFAYNIIWLQCLAWALRPIGYMDRGTDGRTDKHSLL